MGDEEMADVEEGITSWTGASWGNRNCGSVWQMVLEGCMLKVVDVKGT